jgi:hypothetical protein
MLDVRDVLVGRDERIVRVQLLVAALHGSGVLRRLPAVLLGAGRDDLVVQAPHAMHPSADRMSNVLHRAVHQSMTPVRRSVKTIRLPDPGHCYTHWIATAILACDSFGARPV